MLKAIVFDFDGVLVDSEPLHYRAFLRIAQRRLGAEFSYEEYLRRYVGYDDRDVFRVLLGRPPGVRGSPAEEAQIADLAQAKGDAFEAVVREGIDTIPGVVELAREAAGAMPVAIASGATRRDIDLVLGGLGLLELFGVIVTADMVRRSKPDPESYALATDALAEAHPRLALWPGECMAIEDTAAGIDSARAAGLMTLGLASTAAVEQLARAHRVIGSARGLTLAQLRAWFDD